MKKIPVIASLILAGGLAACNSHEKKVLIFAGNDIQVDETQKNISVADGTTYHEKELVYSGSDPITLNLQTPAGKYTVNANDDGLYVLNLEKDTLVGSYQHIGADNGKVKMSKDQLKLAADSLQQLTTGQNISEKNKNYLIAPAKLVKITANTKAKIFGPYTTVPVGFDASTVPEIYKFYTTDGIREIIAKLSVLQK